MRTVSYKNQNSETNFASVSQAISVQYRIPFYVVISPLYKINVRLFVFIARSQSPATLSESSVLSVSFAVAQIGIPLFRWLNFAPNILSTASGYLILQFKHNTVSDEYFRFTIFLFILLILIDPTYIIGYVAGNLILIYKSIRTKSIFKYRIIWFYSSFMLLMTWGPRWNKGDQGGPRGTKGSRMDGWRGAKDKNWLTKKMWTCW